MFGILLSLVSTALLCAFLGVRSRDNPLFLAGSVAFLALGRSVLVDIVPDQSLAHAAWLSVTTSDALFVVLALGWLYARRKRPQPRVFVSVKWWLVGVLLLFFLAFAIALTSASAGSFHVTQVLITRDWFYIPIGYLLCLDILRRFTWEEVQQYVGALSILCVGLAALYIASALGVPVYPYPKYLTTTYGDTTIIRDFLTFPVWFGVAWGYFLARRTNSGWRFVALAVLLCAAILTYTRSILLALAVASLLTILISLVRRGQRGVALAVVAGGALLVLVIAVGAPRVAPAQFGYLQDRYAGFSRPAAVLSDPNVSFRQSLFEEAYRAGRAGDPLFGAGLFDIKATSLAVRYRSYDSDWIRIAYRTGPLGIAMLAAPFVLGLLWGIGRFTKRGPSRPADVVLLAAVAAAAYSGVLQFSGLVYFWWPALSLFSVALIAHSSGSMTAVPAKIAALPTQQGARLDRAGNTP